jgi:hypothetical protein
MELKRPLVEAYWIERDWAACFGGTRVELGRILECTPVDVVKVAPFSVQPIDRVADQGAEFVEGIAKLRAGGARVQLCLGGMDDSAGWNDPADPEALAAAVKELVDRLGADGVDIDNEEPGTPTEGFEATITAIRANLGDEALLTCVSYEPWRDLPWLRNVGHLFDWVSTMAYWEDADAQIQLWRQYAEVVGGQNVVVGVACPGCASPDSHTDLDTVRELAAWVARERDEAAAGMMLWCLSAGPMTERYYEAISEGLRGWWRPGPVPGAARG